ncbi:MAG: collagen binding domain-containing protein [Subdoligranulum sp.]
MKETHYKLKHRVTALFAAAVMLCSMLPGAAFAEEPTPQPTEETVQMEQQTEPSETDNGQTDESSPDPGEDVTEATPETAEEQPAEEEIPAAVVGAELYTDLPDAPIGSYIGSEGLPVATGETKIGISEWPESQLEEGGSYLTAVALDNDGLTMAAPLLDGADYAIVPIMAQVEYPANGSTLDLVLPDSVTLLDYYGAPAEDAESLLHNEYSEISAAVLGVYVQADANFTAQLVYTAPDGSTLTKTLQVAIDRNATAEYPFPDSEIAAFAERPTPAVTSGKITKVAKVNGTWLIWFNGEPAYCCTPGADGQPKNCPTYTYVNTSMVGADQYVPGDHYGNQYRIWGGLTQLSLGMQELPPVALSAEAPSLLDSCRTIYTDAQMQIIENYPDSTAAKILIGSAQTLLEGTDAYASARGYYTYIYQPGRAGWQTVAVIGPEISDDEPNPKPIVQEIYANWEAPAQTASGSFDFDYGIITNKVQLKTTEKVDGATIEIEPITQSGTIDGGTWNISPADKQSVTTAGHTNDDNFQNNGGAASASWTLHYSVSKTTDSRNGRVGPYTTQDEADAAADSARDAAIAELQGEAQRMVDNAVASAKAELANVKFRYEEVGVLYGFEMYWGSNGSNQTISVPANSNNAYLMKNDEWSLQVNIKKTDSETGNQIAADAQYEIFQWDTVTGKYQPTGGYNTYSVQRQGDGTYAVINSAAYATTDSMRHTLYYTQRNAGKFIIVETKAPTGYFGDWTDINHPGMANTPLGKRGYYIEITKDKDNSVIWLDNADYNADVAAADKGGTKLVTSTGVETTVTIYDTSKDPRRTYNTDNSGKAANEDSYTITPTDGVMKNDRTLGEISISKVDLDAVRYVGGSTAHGTALASGQAHGDAALDGAVYDLYAAEDITHPDGVTGVVDYSKIVDTDGNPIWHTTIRDNSGQWVSDYLPVLKKDHLVASAKIENGWLCFSNLYLGKYYVVERSTGVVIPLRDGALAVSGTYPTVDSRIKAATGQTAAFAKNGSGQYTDWVYKNKFSTVSKGKALDGSWTYDAYYLSFAGGYLCDEHNYYITPAYSDEGWYVEKTTFADNRQAAGEQIDKTSYSANYHIHADNALAESQDQVAKGNVEISKIVSSSGQSNGLELEGAGFTFFLVSDLSKAEQFEQTRSGSYTLQSILDDVTFAWDNELNDVVMATSIAKVDGAASSQSFEVVRSKDANADFTEQQTLKFYNDREKAKVGVYKVDSETGNYLAGAVFNLYAADDIYSVDGKLLFAAGELVATSPETGADGYTYFDCDIPIRGEYYGSSIRKDATTNSGNYIVKELRAPLGYYVNEEPMEVTFTYDAQTVMVLDNTCSNKPTEIWVSKRDLTNDEELPGATLAIKDTDGDTVTTWVSTDEPHRVTGLHFGESYTLTEIRAADGYALANDITFRLIQKSDEDGNHLEECEVYYLTTKIILFWKWDDWKLLDDATVIMQDDITKVQISKKDLTTNEELPGAELVIKDKDGTEIDRWISTNGPHYVEKMPAGDYTLTEITAPNGYKVAESIDFTVLPTGEMQTVVMKDAREDTPTPTPDNTPTPDHTPHPRRTRPQRRHPCPLHPLQHPRRC